MDPVVRQLREDKKKIAKDLKRLLTENFKIKDTLSEEIEKNEKMKLENLLLNMIINKLK
jgi:hypothetical protein